MTLEQGVQENVGEGRIQQSESAASFPHGKPSSRGSILTPLYLRFSGKFVGKILTRQIKVVLLLSKLQRLENGRSSVTSSLSVTLRG